MKIAITGSFCTGKTTLAKDLSEATGFRMLPEVARLMIEEGYKLDKEVTPEIEHEIIKRQVFLELGGVYEDIIADRCLIDIAAYCSVLFKNEHDFLNEVSYKLSRARYDFIFYLEPEFSIEDDGIRSTDIKFQKQVDKQIIKILKTKFFPNWYKISGTPKERVSKILKIIKT